MRVIESGGGARSSEAPQAIRPVTRGGSTLRREPARDAYLAHGRTSPSTGATASTISKAKPAPRDVHRVVTSTLIVGRVTWRKKTASGKPC